MENLIVTINMIKLRKIKSNLEDKKQNLQYNELNLNSKYILVLYIQLNDY